MHVYVLHSSNLNRFYVGMSKFSYKRERQHRSGQTYWTSRADDWVLIWTEELSGISAARDLEKKIKSRGTRRFLEDRNIAVPRPAG